MKTFLSFTGQNAKESGYEGNTNPVLIELWLFKAGRSWLPPNFFNIQPEQPAQSDYKLTTSKPPCKSRSR